MVNRSMFGPALVAFAVWNGPSVAQPDSDAAAVAVLERARAHYASLRRVAVTATYLTSIQAEGQQQSLETAQTILAERPNKVAVRPLSDGMTELTLVSDGATVWRYYSAPFGLYESGTAPATLVEVGGKEGFVLGALGTPDQQTWLSSHLLVLSIVDGDRFAELTGGDNSASFIGREDVNGRPHDRVRISGPGLDVDLWVAADGAPWIDRVEPDLTKVIEGMKGQPGMDKIPSIKLELTLADWSAEPAVSPESFVFTAPEGAIKVESLKQAMQKLVNQGEDGAEDQTLPGPPAAGGPVAGWMPHYIDALSLTLWIVDEANADSADSDVYLVIDSTPVGGQYARQGEVWYLGQHDMVRGEKHTFGTMVAPQEFSRDSKGNFAIVNGFSQNGKDFKIARAQVVGRRTENGATTYWRLAKKDFGNGAWVGNDPNKNQYPAVTIDSLETWEQVTSDHPDW